MKRELKKQCKLLVVFTFLAFVLWNCKDDPNSTGMELLPGSDLKTVGQVIEQESITAFTKRDILIRTDEPNYSVFGTFNDPIFGKTTANFACQVRLPYAPDFSKAQEVDSLVLFLYYKNFYGDTLTAQTLKVYELQEDIYLDSTGTSGSTNDYPYYQDVDLKSLASAIPIGELEFTPKIELDSTQTDTTAWQVLAIKLDQSIAEKLFNADSLLYMTDNDVFVKFFKGFYVESQGVDDGGALLDFNTLTGGIALYYRDFLKDNKIDTVSFSYPINSNSARISSYEHDYSATNFVSKLENETEPDSLIYLQTMGGLRAKINVPSLDNWKDSMNIVINKAKLIFQVDTTLSDFHNFKVSDQIVLRAIDNTDITGEGYLPSDIYISSSLYGGYFNSEDATYSFNITHHLQDIIDQDNEIDNYGFYLSTAYQNERARRVVLKGSTSHVGIRLEVTYTKLN